jgi:hypothetical protein
MLAEIGAQFSLKGIDEAIRKLQAAGSEFGRFSSGIDPAVSKVEAGSNRMARSFEKMSSRIHRSMTAAKLAVGAFITGKALKGVADWVSGNADMDKAKDFLRQYGAGPKEFEAYREHLKGLRGKIPGISGADYYTGMYDVQSMFGAQSSEMNKKALESTLYMAKALDPKATIATASNLMRTFAGSFGLGKSEPEQLALMDKFSAQMRTMLSQTKTRGQDVQTSMPHVAALYSQMGRSPADMLADIGIVGGVLHERSGELLRAVMSKQGEGYGKLIAALKKESFLSRVGAESTSDLPEKLRSQLAKSEKLEQARHARIGGKMLADDPDAYWRNMNKALGLLEEYRKTRGTDSAKILSEAFGETAVQGLPLLAKAHASGEHGKLSGALAGADPAAAQQAIDSSFQSFNAKYEIFQGKVAEMSRSVRAAFQGVVADQFEDYGKVFERITGLWDRNSKELVANMRAFVSEFKAGFSAAFGGLPDITGQVDRLVTLLCSANPDKWKQLGQEWGKLVGTDLGAFKSAIADIMTNAKTLADALKTIADVIKWVQGKEEKGADALDAAKHADWEAKRVLEKYAPNMPQIPLLNSPWDPFGLASGSAAAPTGPTAAPENMAFKDWTGPTVLKRPGYAGGEAGPDPAGLMAGAMPGVEMTPQFNVNVTAEFGEDMIARVAAVVIEKMGNEQDRMRGNATSGQLGWAR